MFYKKNIPVLLLLVLCCLLAGHAIAKDKDRKSKEIIYKGNKFKLPDKGTKVPEIITDPVIGKETVQITERDPQPFTINGEQIYNIGEVTTPPASTFPNMPIEEYLLNKIKGLPQIASLPDGFLSIDLDDIIVDKEGKVVYYDFNGIHYAGPDKIKRKLNVADADIDTLFEDIPVMKPAMLNSNKVNVRMDITLLNYKVEIKDHMVSLHTQVNY